MTKTILFLCPHAAAKSVIAAAYCQKLADQLDLELNIDSAGTEPDAKVAPAVVELLRAEGIDVASHVPRRVTHEELESVTHVVSLGCDLSALALSQKIIEYWDDVPSPSEDLMQARDMIYAHVEQFVAEVMREG